MNSLLGARPSVPLSRSIRSAAVATLSRPLWGSLVLGTAGFLVSFAGAWIPSPWLDEAATAHIISYPLADMARLWQQTDVVYAPYYFFMHVLAGFTGINPLSLRVPSAVAVGVGTAAMAASGRSIGGIKSQILYAACFALMPRMTAMGIEARPYAFTAMFMALALLLIVKLRQAPSTARWVLLGLAMMGAVGSQFFAALPLAALIAVAAIFLPWRSRFALLVTSVLAGIVCLPLWLAAVPQQGQVSWIGGGGYSIADQALVEAWFTSRWNVSPSGTDVPLHYVAVGVAVVAAGTVILALATGKRPFPKDRLALALVPPLMAVGALWTVSLVHSTPVLLGRYLTSSVPFVAMLLAESLLLVRHHVRQLLAALLAVGCVLIVVAQREPYSKIPGYDYSFISSSLQEARTGDGFLMEPGLGPVDSARNAIDLYPQDFGRLVDIAQPRRAPLTFVFTADPAVVDLRHRPLPQRIWLVTKNQQESRYAAQLSALGFKEASAMSGPAHTVALWTHS